MIVYDKFYKISGMSKRALEILKYNDVNDFLSAHNDLDEIAMNYQKDENSSFMQSLLNRAPEGINLSLKSKDGQILSVKAVPNEILMTNKDKIYELELTLNEEIPKALANDTAKEQPILRMPLLWGNGMQRSGAKEQAVLDDKWFEQTREFLNLNSVDFASYLALLAKGVQSYLIALQNAIVARDKLSIKKIVTTLKEPATNLRVSALVKIYDSLENSDSIDFAAFIAGINERVYELNKLANKYQGKA